MTTATLESPDKGSWRAPLEAELDAARVRPELGILEPIHPHLEWITRQSGDFGIETRVVRDRKEVAGDERHPHLPKVVEETDPPQLVLRQRITDRQLFQLGVRPLLDEEVVGIEAVVEADPVVAQRLLRAARHRV